MGKHLSHVQIESTCRQLLAQQRSVTVREVMLQLKFKFGTGGRTGRVSRILSRCEALFDSPAGAVAKTESSALASLEEQLRKAQERAERAEELERRHQDFWAARYAERVAELSRRSAPPSPSTISADQYLRIHQRAAELARRLAEYEPVEPLPALPQSATLSFKTKG